MNNKLWDMFKISGHIEDYLRYVMGDEKFDNFLNFAGGKVTSEGGEQSDWTDGSNGHRA